MRAPASGHGRSSLRRSNSGAGFSRSAGQASRPGKTLGQHPPGRRRLRGRHEFGCAVMNEDPLETRPRELARARQVGRCSNSQAALSTSLLVYFRRRPMEGTSSERVVNRFLIFHAGLRALQSRVDSDGSCEIGEHAQVFRAKHRAQARQSLGGRAAAGSSRATIAGRRRGSGRVSMRRISMPMRSALTVVTSAAMSWMASNVAGSIAKSNVAAKRTARSIRSLSSLSRKRGSPMARMMRAEVVLAADVVDDLVGERVVEQAVDREVAALGVVLGVGERDAVGVAAVAVRAIGAESGDLDLAGRARAEHGDRRRRRRRWPACGGGRKGRGSGRAWRGGDVVVFRRDAQQLIAHAAAGPQRFVSRPRAACGRCPGQSRVGPGGHALSFLSS